VLIANLYIHVVMGSLLFFTSIFMIFIILIQRGRGGGLAGALGGSGGSSAFGAKAGDTFTRVTAGLAIFWFVLCLLSILLIQGPRVAPLADRQAGASGSGAAPTGSPEAENGTGLTPPADGTTVPGTDLPPLNLPPLDLPTGDGSGGSETPPGSTADAESTPPETDLKQDGSGN